MGHWWKLLKDGFFFSTEELMVFCISWVSLLLKDGFFSILSAGPAASTSVGLVPFAIGSETAGSLTYPAARCGITCLRPTFGTVGRSGVMSISESLDKLGPFCRSAEDGVIIIDTIRGKDPDDLSSRDVPLDDPFSVDIKKLTVGYLEDAEMEVVNILSSKGVKVVPFKLKYTVSSVQAILDLIMDVDMLSPFDEWQRSGHDDQYEAQDQWPVELRRARLVPAVDYLQDELEISVKDKKKSSTCIGEGFSSMISFNEINISQALSK